MRFCQPLIAIRTVTALSTHRLQPLHGAFLQKEIGQIIPLERSEIFRILFIPSSVQGNPEPEVAREINIEHMQK